MRNIKIKRLTVRINKFFGITHWKYVGDFRYSRQGVQECTGIDATPMGGQVEEWEDVDITIKELLNKPAN